MTFGAFISARRKDLKLNLRETAKHLKIAYGYLSDIEQSRRPAPDGDFVDRISAFLQLDKRSMNFYWIWQPSLEIRFQRICRIISWKRTLFEPHSE